MIATMKKLTPLALAMTLAGCMSLAPKYERPAVSYTHLTLPTICSV